MKLAKKFFALLMGVLVLMTVVPNGLAMHNGEEFSPAAPVIQSLSRSPEIVRVAVFTYSDEKWNEIYELISHGGNPIEGRSPTDGRFYQVQFVRLDTYPTNYTDKEFSDYISSIRGVLADCCGCIFVYDLHEVCKSYDGPLLAPWEMRDNGYGNAVREECRRWCHAIEAVNPERFFLFIPDKTNFTDPASADFWGGYACDDICKYCERPWLSKYPSHGQFVGAIPVPTANYDIISSYLLRVIPNHNHTRNLIPYRGFWGTCKYMLKKNESCLELGGIVLGAIVIGGTLYYLCTGGSGNGHNITNPPKITNPKLTN